MSKAASALRVDWKYHQPTTREEPAHSQSTKRKLSLLQLAQELGNVSKAFVERMNRTLLDECFRIGGRSTWYESVEQLQADLDQYLERYNLRRSHQDYRLAGRTPTQALADALSVTVDDLLPLLIAPNEDQLTPAA